MVLEMKRNCIIKMARRRLPSTQLPYIAMGPLVLSLSLLLLLLLILSQLAIGHRLIGKKPQHSADRRRQLQQKFSMLGDEEPAGQQRNMNNFVQKSDLVNLANIAQPNHYNDTRPEILVSYLGAVNQYSQLVLDRLSLAGNSHSNEIVEQLFNMTLNMRSCASRYFEGTTISGALQVAIDDVNRNPKLLPNYQLRYIFNNTCGDEFRSTEYFMDHWRKGAKVFIGPEVNCRTEATMAAAQNLPLISHKCKDQSISDKKKYPTFARTVPAESVIARSFMALLEHFRWRKFAVIFERHMANQELFNAIKRMLDTDNERAQKQQKKMVQKGSESSNGVSREDYDDDDQMDDEQILLMNDKNKDYRTNSDNPYTILNVSMVPHPFQEISDSHVRQIRQIVAENRAGARIYVTFGNVRLFRHILLEMGEMGMMEDGQYALVYLDTDYNWFARGWPLM